MRAVGDQISDGNSKSYRSRSNKSPNSRLKKSLKKPIGRGSQTGIGIQ